MCTVESNFEGDPLKALYLLIEGENNQLLSVSL